MPSCLSGATAGGHARAAFPPSSVHKSSVLGRKVEPPSIPLQSIQVMGKSLRKNASCRL